MAFSGTLQALLTGASTGSGLPDLGEAVFQFPGNLLPYIQSFTNGTGDNQANIVWGDTRTLASTSETIDIRGTSLTGFFGEVVSFAKVKAILVRCNGAAPANTLKMGGDALHVPFLDDPAASVIIPNSGWMCFVGPKDGWAVAAGATDILKFTTNYSGTYDVILIGVSV